MLEKLYEVVEFGFSDDRYIHKIHAKNPQQAKRKLIKMRGGTPSCPWTGLSMYKARLAKQQ